MSDLKASAETLASALSGTEYWRAVQSGSNVRMTAAMVAALVNGSGQVAQTFTGTVTFDLTAYAGIAEVVIYGTATGNFTFNPTNGEAFQKITLYIKQDATGSRLWTSGANIRLNTDIASITLTTTAAKTDFIAMRWHPSDGKADVLAVIHGA